MQATLPNGGVVSNNQAEEEYYSVYNLKNVFTETLALTLAGGSSTWTNFGTPIPATGPTNGTITFTGNVHEATFTTNGALQLWNMSGTPAQVGSDIPATITGTPNATTITFNFATAILPLTGSTIYELKFATGTEVKDDWGNTNEDRAIVTVDSIQRFQTEGTTLAHIKAVNGSLASVTPLANGVSYHNNNAVFDIAFNGAPTYTLTTANFADYFTVTRSIDATALINSSPNT